MSPLTRAVLQIQYRKECLDGTSRAMDNAPRPGTGTEHPVLLLANRQIFTCTTWRIQLTLTLTWKPQHRVWVHSTLMQSLCWWGHGHLCLVDGCQKYWSHRDFLCCVISRNDCADFTIVNSESGEGTCWSVNVTLDWMWVRVLTEATECKVTIKLVVVGRKIV